MRSISKKIVALLSSVVILAGLVSSCHDDSPKEETTDSDWRSNLESRGEFFTHRGFVGGGHQYVDFTCGFRITDKDGNDLLSARNPQNVRNSDFYFEHDGQKYFVGDSTFDVGITNNDDKVCFPDHISGRFNLLSPFGLCYENIVNDRKTIDVSFDFVWPSRNIRKHMRVYIEPNLNFYDEVEAFQKDTAFEPDPFFIEAYKSGFWVDGEMYNTYINPLYVMTVE